MDRKKTKDIEPFYHELGARIRDARDNLGMSQRVLGEAIEPKPMTRAAIANIENGGQRVLTYTLTQIANKLNVQVTDLLPDVRQNVEISNQNMISELQKKLKISPSKLEEMTSKIERSRADIA